MLTREQVMKALHNGATIIVKARNGDCLPMFYQNPKAYRCSIGKRLVDSEYVNRLNRRRLISVTNPGWYTEGKFQINSGRRDERGRFLKQEATPHVE